MLEAAMRGMAARDQIGEDRFVDVGQPELQADPIGVAQRIYDFAGIDLTDDVRSAMIEWSGGKEAGPRGEHRYAPEDFGLTDAQIRAAFSEYLNRFGDYCRPRS